MQEDIVRIKGLREKELKKGAKFQKLEQQMKELSHEIVRLNTQLELKTKNITEEEEKGKSIQQNIVELQRQFEAKAAEFGEMQQQFSAMTEAHNTLRAEVSAKEELLETLRTGVAAKEGQKNGFMDKLEGTFLP